MSGSPRTSGGASVLTSGAHVPSPKSPHQRGCVARGDGQVAVGEEVPAPAGVRPAWCCARRWASRSPRTSGGASDMLIREAVADQKSPHQRGCVPVRVGHVGDPVEVPAPAGVRPAPPRSSRSAAGSPRTSGGASSASRQSDFVTSKSPHQRGCVELPPDHQRGQAEVPAPAGVRLARAAWRGRRCGSPRTSGGASLISAALLVALLKSPHQRGCVLHLRHRHAQRGEVPAPAGVRPWSPIVALALAGSPRTQRGCVRRGERRDHPHREVPAPAGVRPQTTPLHTRALRSPRTSGGASRRADAWGAGSMKSPHQRGCVRACSLPGSGGKEVPRQRGGCVHRALDLLDILPEVPAPAGVCPSSSS